MRSLLLLCFWSIGLSGFGQTIYYQFTQSTGTLETQPGSGVTSLVAAASADGVSAVTAIGFNLNYAGTVYTQFSASANGLIRLGGTAVTAENVNTITSATNVPKIMGFWDNMATGTSASGGGVKTWSVGATPSRKRVVDFKLASNNLTASAYDLQFQVWIYETSGKIEIVYGAGAASGMSASIGIGGPTASEYLSVTPGGMATVSSAAANNVVSANPGAGVKYTFAPPAPLTGAKTIGTGMNYPTLKDAVNVLNWVGVGSGGVTFNISGGHTETVPAGSTVPNPDMPAGICITANGTAANPIVFQWNSVGAKPIFKAGAGIGNFDFVIGISGGDYITLDGLEIQEDNTNNTTNAKRAEIGIGLFKKQYNTSLGNDGCANVTVKNCKITLTRDPNAVGNYAYCQDAYFTTGIKASAFTCTHQGATNFYEGGNPNGGIKSQNDVHRNCVIIGNTIDNCSYGITFADRWAESGGNVFAGSGNVIGQSGAGNTVTNWGLKAGSSIAYGVNESDMGRVVAGIAIGGQKDYTIEYNTVTTCGTNLQNNDATGPYSYCGILAGTGYDGNSWPHFAAGFFAKITHNTVSDIDLTSGTNVGKSGIGISFAQFADHVTNTNLSTRLSSGNVEITYNTISNIKVNRHDLHGISCKYYYEYFRRALQSDDRTGGFQTNGNVTISNNTIKGLTKKTGNSNDAYYDGTFSAIYWMHGQNNLYIENNTIGGAGTDGLVRGVATHAFIARNLAGSRMIWVNAQFDRGTRSLVQVKNNTITNVDAIGSAAMAAANNWAVGFSAIFIDKGATNNVVEANTITGCDIANGGRDADAESALALIYVNGKPRSGNSTVNIASNILQNNSRTLYRYYGTSAGLRGFTAGIYAPYETTSQTKNIYNNVIDGLTGTAINATNSYLYWASITGIRAKANSNATSSVTSIYGNTIKNLGGDTYSYNHTYNVSHYANYERGYNTIGINVCHYFRMRIYGNSICNLSTNSTGYPTDQNFMNGVVGIMYGNEQGEIAPISSISDPKVAVYNNFIGQLSAPAMRGRLAVLGAYQWGINQVKVFAHNTIALGSLAGLGTGRLSSTTAGAFGVSGFVNHDYHLDNKTIKTIFSNNVISINADCKGTGMGTAWRHYVINSPKRMWKGISTASTGNVYFVNDDANNYIYGQGVVFNTSGGIRNCFGYGASVTTNATQNLVNDNVLPKNFNELCGKYKAFMGGREKGSFIDLDVSNVMKAIPFTGTGGCQDEMKIADASTSYVASAKRIQSPYFSIGADYYSASRGASTVTAGAHENTPNITGSPVYLIDFDYEPICNSVCTGAKSLTATITAPSGKAIATAAGKTPRLYFRRIQNASAITAAQSDNNVMVNSANNNATGTEGWRWVEASTVAGNDYTFNIDESLLKNTIVTAATYTVEYFIIAETSDGTVCNWSSGDLSTNCPTTVDLFTVGGAAAVPADDDGDTAIAQNSVDDAYTVYTGASLTKSLFFVNDGKKYTANIVTPLPVCTGDEIKVTGQFTVTSTGESFNDGCVSYKMEVADNSAFSVGLQSFIQSDSAFSYTMAAAGTKYFRVWLNCGGVNVASSNTVYVAVTAADMPVNTTAPPDLNSCVSVAQSITVTTTTPTVSKYFWVANPHGKLYVNPPTAATALSQARSVNPADTTESGTWHTYVTLASGASLTNMGVLAADYYDGAQYNMNGGDVDTTKGVAFHANAFIKLNSISVLDDPNDGATSAGFNISLYSSSGVLLYKTAAQTTTDGQLKQIALTNWYVPPGDYMIVMGASTLGAEPTGGLSVASATFPVGIANTSTSGLTLLGGVSDLDFTGYDAGTNYYFFDWDVTILCTSNDVTFNYKVNPASCCAMPAPAAALITGGATSADLVASNCANLTGNWIYYFDPADPAKLLCAVEPNGNTWRPSTITVYNTGASSDASHLTSDANSTSELMPYMLQIDNSTDLTANGGVKVRMFYPAAQKSIVDAYSVKNWFKFSSDKQGILDNLMPDGLAGKEILTPAATGTENSIPYVEFHNITSFSTFGFLGTNCSATATIVETDNSCTTNDNIIANGSSATMTASGGVSYVWDDLSTAAARVVSPTTTTTYTVTVTDANGCTGTASNTITVVTAPTAAIAEADNSCTANDGKVLSGATVTLTASGLGSYAWDDLSTAAMRTVTPAATTTYTVTVSDANGCTASASSTVTVVSAPTPAISETDNSCATNDSKVLSGATATLTASGGGSYNWDNLSTAAIRAVMPTMSTTYTVTVTDANGCTASTSQLVQVVSGTTAAIVQTDNSCTPSDGQVLSGDAAVLTATGTGSYSWDNLSTASVRIVNPVSTSTYTVTVTDTDGCTASASSTVNVVSAPVAVITGASSICVSGTTTLTPTSGGTWASSNPAVATVTNAGVVTGVSTGSATFTFTSTTSGCASAATMPVTVTQCNVYVSPKVLLSGPYNESNNLMNDGLRSSGVIPTNQPFNSAQYTDIGYAGTETIGAGVLSVTGLNAIVDWVLVELHDASTPSTIVARQAALVQRDGDVVSAADGFSPVGFAGLGSNTVYVAIRHRNHLGVMTANTVTLSSISVVVDFTSVLTANYQLAGPQGSTYAQRTLNNGKRALWEGNLSNVSGTGNRIIYQGSNSDSDEAYYKVLLHPMNVGVLPNYIVTGYERADANLDGMVIFQGGDSDSDVPFFTVLTFPANLMLLPNYVIVQQIP